MNNHKRITPDEARAIRAQVEAHMSEIDDLGRKLGIDPHNLAELLIAARQLEAGAADPESHARARQLCVMLESEAAGAGALIIEGVGANSIQPSGTVDNRPNNSPNDGTVGQK